MSDHVTHKDATDKQHEKPTENKDGSDHLRSYHPGDGDPMSHLKSEHTVLKTKEDYERKEKHLQALMDQHKTDEFKREFLKLSPDDQIKVWSEMSPKEDDNQAQLLLHFEEDPLTKKRTPDQISIGYPKSTEEREKTGRHYTCVPIMGKPFDE